jgi:Fe2+ transport system protein FeoA
MSYVRLAFSSRSEFASRGVQPKRETTRESERVSRVSRSRVPLSSLTEGTRATVIEVSAHAGSRADRLLALGVTPGASVMVLQTFPGVVFRCDQTELAVERSVASTILVQVQEIPS